MNRKQRRAVAKAPTTPGHFLAQDASCETLFLLAVQHLQAGQWAQAESLYHDVLTRDQHHSGALHHLGIIALNRRLFDESVTLIGKALRLKPDYAEAYNNLGIARQEQGNLPLAHACFKSAIVCKPDYADAYTNLGSAIGQLGQPAESETALRHCLTIHPTYVKGICNLAFVLSWQNRPDEAISAYRAAIRINPDFAQAHYELGLLLLRHGQFQEGWKEYEWRWKTSYHASKSRNFPQSRWTGEDLSNRTILLYGEQGFGDELQFSRYATLVADRGARVVLEVYRPLVQLLRNVPGVAEIVAHGDTLPPFDYHLPLMSVPYILGTNLTTVPANVPYVTVNPAAAARWRDRLSTAAEPKIGLAWAGEAGIEDRTREAMDARRSISLTRLAPLLALPGFTFISLQKGNSSLQIPDLAPELRPFHFMDEISDFSDTAALIANIDLVISVNTSVAHLAGAMGKRVWVLSRFDGCWRWLQDRDDSPWYPTARLFRQIKPGDWDDVIKRVAIALNAREYQ